MFEKIKYYRTVLTADYAPYVDKLVAKELAKTLCPEIRTARTVRVLGGPDDLHESDANPLHILKAVHGSGWIIYPTPPLNLVSLRNRLRSWMRPYSLIEKQYTFIKPRFLKKFLMMLTLVSVVTHMSSWCDVLMESL